jgi:signal transduction histidine kinase
MMALSADELIHPDDLAGVRDTLAQLADRTDHAPIIYRGRRKDGVYIWVEASLTRSTDSETGVSEIVSVLREVSGRIHYEDMLRQAKESADSANRAKSELLATMSHELRTPLNAIIGFSDMMRAEVHGPLGVARYAEYAKDIHDSGSHLLDIINDILDLAKIDAGKLELHDEESVDPARVIEACVTLVKPHADLAAVHLSTDIEDNLHFLVADPTRLKQILLNLLSNAIKATGRDGAVTTAVRRSKNGGMVFEVRDTGLGMTKAEVEIALQPFGQVDADRTQAHEGTGLGLPLAQRLAELHGGSLHIKSRKGRGTTVTVTLPAGRVSVRSPVPAAASTAA